MHGSLPLLGNLLMAFAALFRSANTTGIQKCTGRGLCLAWKEEFIAISVFEGNGGTILVSSCSLAIK